MVEAVEASTGRVQDGHLQVSKLDPQDAIDTIQSYLALMEGIYAITREVAELARGVDIGLVLAESGRLLHFIRGGCKQELARHFRAQGWLDTKTPKMVESWSHPYSSEGPSRVLGTLQGIDSAFWATFLQAPESYTPGVKGRQTRCNGGISTTGAPHHN
ncbi:hypothetical protein SUGI_0584930 [Cryptomeria japonica]|nr:hypothetical protein SUGI_0584930 [Cryptomeria japonica]